MAPLGPRSAARHISHRLSSRQSIRQPGLGVTAGEFVAMTGREVRQEHIPSLLAGYWGRGRACPLQLNQQSCDLVWRRQLERAKHEPPIAIDQGYHCGMFFA